MTQEKTLLPQTPSFDLTSRLALVTGASSGIGLASAVALAKAGATVCLASRNIDKLNELAQKLNVELAEAKSQSSKVFAIKLDITNIHETERKILELTAKQGPFDILVNSAGSSRHSFAVDTKEEDFDYLINLNLKGAYFITRLIAKELIQAKQPGSLINISSQMGLVGGIRRSVYCATKFAVEGFTKAMAIEFGSQAIRINTICPTFIKTPLTKHTLADNQQLSTIKQKIKLHRVGKVEDIMGAVVYLASDASSLVTGSSLTVDGGWTSD